MDQISSASDRITARPTGDILEMTARQILKVSPDLNSQIDRLLAAVKRGDANEANAAARDLIAQIQKQVYRYRYIYDLPIYLIMDIQILFSLPLFLMIFTLLNGYSILFYDIYYISMYID